MIKTKYTKEFLEPIVVSSKNMAEVCRKIGIHDNGRIRKTISNLGIATDHLVNQRKYYTDDDVKISVSESKSIAQVLKRLGLFQGGGNYDNIMRKIQSLGLDMSHFTGQRWNKSIMTKDWKDYGRGTQLRKNLLRERGNICEECRRTEWFDKPIKLELHHVDGDKTNSSLENLRLLCPNCHSFTDTWRASKK